MIERWHEGRLWLVESQAVPGIGTLLLGQVASGGLTGLFPRARELLGASMLAAIVAILLGLRHVRRHTTPS